MPPCQGGGEGKAMSARNVVVIGTQWGDEGKGKIVDWLTDHAALDRAREAAKGAHKIGTTGRGIGPAYEDKVARRAIRLQDLFKPQRFAEKLRGLIEFHNFVLEKFYQQPGIDFQQTLDQTL